MTEGTAPARAAPREDMSHHLASYSVDLVDLGSRPEWHLDRTLYGPWQRYELAARDVEGDELARVRGTGSAECWYRLAGALGRTTGWKR